MAVAPKTGAETERLALSASEQQLLDDLYAVVILDSDRTTFAEVEAACVALFGYTPDEAAALALKVHTTGEAVAAVMARQPATEAIGALRRGNVRARMDRL